MISYNRHDDTRPAACLHVAHSLEGHQTRAEGAEVAVEPRVSLPVERQECPGEAGYRDAAVQDGHFCQRVLLARTQHRVELDSRKHLRL